VNAALYASIWIALVCFVLGEAGKPRRWAWRVSLTGALLCVFHIVLAFGYRHGWSHEAAVRETARQTASVYGLDWGGGVYVNYVFVAVWLTELTWWRARDVQYARRSPPVKWVTRAFYFTILFNAAVVFATTSGRLAGVALTTALMWIWARFKM
jgi:hypothetical protein